MDNSTAGFRLCLPALLLLVLGVAQRCQAADCGPATHSAVQVLQTGNVAEAKRQFRVALEESASRDCQDQAVVMLAALSLADIAVYKGLAAHGTAALHNPGISMDDARQWGGIGSYSIEALGNVLIEDRNVFRDLLGIEHRYIGWEIPTMELTNTLSELFRAQSDLIGAFNNGQWHDGYESVIVRSNLAFFCFASSLDQYWNSSSRRMDIAAVLSDLGNAYLFLDAMPLAEKVYRRVLELTRDDPSSKWRTHAKYGLSEIEKRTTNNE